MLAKSDSDSANAARFDVTRDSGPDLGKRRILVRDQEAAGSNPVTPIAECVFVPPSAFSDTESDTVRVVLSLISPF